MPDEIPVNTTVTGNRLAGDMGFKDKTVFMSGGTGFIGKVLIEKILRTCPLVEKIYVLIRTKKNKDPQQRIRDICNGPLFDLVKKVRGEDILKKVVAIPGDILEIGLGMSEEHVKLVHDEVQIMLHIAATIRFDEPLKYAILMNTRGTKFMLDLAKGCKKLLCFTYVSTAYCHLHEKILHEKAYPPPADPDTVINAVEWLGDEIENIRDSILGDFPNTYAFTKALAEDLVYKQVDTLPVIILRPSVVIPVWKEPIPGWTDNINGPAGLLIAAGKGVLRTMYCDSKGYADYLPVDIMANIIILTAFDKMNFKERVVYNCTSSFEFKVTWEEIIDLGRNLATSKIPLNGVAWYPGGSLKKSRWQHNICVVIFHYLPALLLDPIIWLSGNKPVLWRVQNRITKGFEVFEYYTNNQWEFKNDGSRTARALLSEEEKQIYKIDGGGIDLEDYFYHCIHATRLYILNEPDDTLPAARRHMKVMWAVDRLTRFFLAVWMGYLVMNHIVYPLMGY